MSYILHFDKYFTIDKYLKIHPFSSCHSKDAIVKPFHTLSRWVSLHSTQPASLYMAAIQRLHRKFPGKHYFANLVILILIYSFINIHRSSNIIHKIRAHSCMLKTSTLWMSCYIKIKNSFFLKLFVWSKPVDNIHMLHLFFK